MNFNAQIAFKSGKSTHHDPGISGKRAGNELSGKRTGSAQSSSTVPSAAARMARASRISSSDSTKTSFGLDRQRNLVVGRVVNPHTDCNNSRPRSRGDLAWE